MYNLIDLFSGIGGFSLGLMNAGLPIKQHYFSEVDKYAIANYQYNFKNSIYAGPVENVQPIPGKSIVTFGSPCQDFSLAGKRKGMGGQRSSLIRHAITYITKQRPSVFVWENVKGAFSSNNGADFWAIIQAFANIGGYRLEWQLLNTSWLLPQNRERIYLIGHLAGESKSEVFPIRESDFRATQRESKAATVRTITAGGNSGGHHSGMTLIKKVEVIINSQSQSKRVYSTEGLSPTLDTAIHALRFKENPVIVQRGHRYLKTNIRETSPTIHGNDFAGNHPVLLSEGVKAIKFERTEKAKKERSENRKKGKDSNSFSDKKIGFRNDGLMTTLTTAANKDNLLFESQVIRRLTEVECERLQGFPDDWTKLGMFDGVKKEIAKTQRYKLCGNAVSVPVVQMVGERILKGLKL